MLFKDQLLPALIAIAAAVVHKRLTDQMVAAKTYPPKPAHHLDDMGPAFPVMTYNDAPFFSAAELN